jgi:hypothetical protein
VRCRGYGSVSYRPVSDRGSRARPSDEI